MEFLFEMMGELFAEVLFGFFGSVLSFFWDAALGGIDWIGSLVAKW